MKKLYAILTAAALACAISLPAAAQDSGTAKLKRTQMAEKKEAHPEIESAMHHLREAKENLEHAAHDFGGHRASALKHVNEALEECRQALAYDKK
jgi:uncharacterized protein involved in copper resistance